MARSDKSTPPGGLVAAGLADMAYACRNATTRIDIGSPFLSADVTGYLVRACDDGKARDRRFITARRPAVLFGKLRRCSTSGTARFRVRAASASMLGSHTLANACQRGEAARRRAPLRSSLSRYR